MPRPTGKVWRHRIKRLLPAVLLNLLGSRPAPPPVWSGVYPRLSDVPAHRAEFGDDLIGEMVTTVAAALAALRAGQKPHLWHESLALLAGAVASASQRVSVVDFGGGAGSGFAQLLASLPPSVTLAYEVVDSEAMCTAGRKLFADDRRIRFSTTLPPRGSAIDVVYANSVLQYIEDYPRALQQLAAVGAPYVFLGRLAAGRGPTFATRQLNVPGRVFPYWFLNLDEVIAVMAQHGYQLACDSLVDHVYDQTNLPESHRAERFRNVLFARRASTGPE